MLYQLSYTPIGPALPGNRAFNWRKRSGQGGSAGYVPLFARKVQGRAGAAGFKISIAIADIASVAVAMTCCASGAQVPLCSEGRVV